MADLTTLQAFIGIALIAIGIGFLISLIFATGSEGGARRLARFAERSGAPVPAAIEVPLQRRERRERIVEASGALVGIVICGIALASPVGRSPLFPLTVFLPVLMLSTQFATTGLALREQLFSPPPGAPRVARTRVVTSGDYLGRFARAVTWAIAGLTIAGAAWVVLASLRDVIARPEAAIAALAVSVVAVGATVAVPFVESAILAKPQPATTPLELAWNDLFRTSAMNAARLSAAALCYVALLLIAFALVPGSGDAATWPISLFVFGQLALSRLYPTAGAPLPRRLFPQGILVPDASPA